MENKINIEFKGYLMELTVFLYNRGRVGMLMTEKWTKQFHGSITINMDCNIPNNEILLKNYNENIGIYEALLERNIINPLKRKIRIGNNEAYVCSLTKEFINKIKI